MKTTTIIFFLFTVIFARDVNNDVAYGLVMQKLDGALPETFVIDAFSHDKPEVHKVIAERFAKPYEKKPWTEYRRFS